jgi:hypothetical protein
MSARAAVNLSVDFLAVRKNDSLVNSGATFGVNRTA